MWESTWELEELSLSKSQARRDIDDYLILFSHFTEKKTKNSLLFIIIWC